MPGQTTLFPGAEARSEPLRTGHDLLAALYRQAGLVAICAVVGTAASLLLYMRQPRVYTSSAKVWVQTEQQGSPSFLSGITAYRETPDADPVNRKIETEIELMLTRANAQAVVDKYHITESQLVRGIPGQPRAEVVAASGVPESRERTVDLFLDGLSVEPMRSKTADTSSNVLEVKFECADPALAPLALQAFLDNYLKLGVQQNHRLGETTSRLIETQIAQAKDDLRDAEDSIVALQARNAGHGGDGLTGGGVAATGSLVASAYAATEGGLRLDMSPDMAGGSGSGVAPVVSSLKQQTLELQQRLDEARQLYTDNAENVRHLREQLASAKQRLAATVRGNSQMDAELTRLQRTRELAQQRYVELQRKLDQIDLYMRLNPTETQSRVVIDAPDRPTTADGKKKKTALLLGPAAGLLLGLLLAFLRELGGDRMRTPREAKSALGLPVLGAIPTLSNKAVAAYLSPSSGARSSFLSSVLQMEHAR